MDRRRRPLAGEKPGGTNCGRREIYHISLASWSIICSAVTYMRRKALIVEDDENTRRLLGKLVETQDCKVDEAADGLKALELLSKNDYDLVLLDIVLPKVSGTQVMDHICATNPALLE